MLFSTLCLLLFSHFASSNIFEGLPKNLVTVNLPTLSKSAKNNIGYAEDGQLTFPELCNKYGYKAEEHTLTTADGYILKMYRIPNKLGSKKNRKPVLAMHPVTCDADIWIISGPNYSVGYQLVDNGYDVWFPSFRGTKYSREHVEYDPDTDVEYWLFSYDEMAKYDLPASIDYILNSTNSNSLSYVGISQGTTIFYAMGAYKPDYYDKVNVMVSLASVAYLTNAKSPLLRLLATQANVLGAISDVLGMQEFFRNSSAVNQIVEFVCHSEIISQVPCRNIMFITMGFDDEQMRNELIPVIYGHIPQSVSRQNLLHLGQGFHHNRFQMFDGGASQNMKKYGSEYPPQYNLSLVKTPVAAIMGSNDWLSSIKDVDKILAQLPNVIERHIVPRAKWQHLDYILATEACELVGKKIIHHFNNYSGCNQNLEN